jgi:hypothetical protein
VRWQRFADHFPWRITVLLALLFGLQSLSLWTWFRWEVPPLQRYYFWAYFNCTEGAKQANTQTRIQWLFKTAPGRKHQVIVEQDVFSGRDGDLPVQLSPSALATGWMGIEKSSPQQVNCAELEGFLREDFYGHRGFWQLIAEPLLDCCVLLLVPAFLMLVMKEELALELSRLRKDVVEAASRSDHDWDASANRHRITESIRLRMPRWKWLGSLGSRRTSPALDTRRNADANQTPIAGMVGGDRAPLSALVQQASSGAKPTGKTLSVHPLKKPAKRQSIFPGRAGVRASNQKPKPWDPSQWID